MKRVYGSSQPLAGLYLWLDRMKHSVCFGILPCFLFVGCTKNSISNWFVEEVSKPNATEVTAVRLTPAYTILDVQFTNPGKTFYTQKKQSLPIGYICVSPNSKLIASSVNRTYSLIKAKGIRLLPHVVRVDPFEQVSFSLYFERLDKGIESFDWIDTIVTDTHTFHYEFPGLSVENPGDNTHAR
ncbi:hypothetical protein EXU85_00640 [Spirosoma sp. KCTC 42546]|nr:hypothetical protein EXU85_00640 [Spirosoma sp. KCTC 42546]